MLCRTPRAFSPPVSARSGNSSRSKEALERKTEELAQANRRLILLNQVANSLILGEMPQEQLKAAFDAVAQELGAEYYFNYRIDEKDPDILILGSFGRSR